MNNIIIKSFFYVQKFTKIVISLNKYRCKQKRNSAQYLKCVFLNNYIKFILFVNKYLSYHPTIWKFIKALKKEQSLNETKIEQYIAGQQPPIRKKIQRFSNETQERVNKL